MSYDIYHSIYQYIYQVTYLGIFPSKAMSSQIKGVASCLGPSSVIITLPLKCAECSQMIPISARNFKFLVASCRVGSSEIRLR